MTSIMLYATRMRVWCHFPVLRDRNGRVSTVVALQLTAWLGNTPRGVCLALRLLYKLPLDYDTMGKLEEQPCTLLS
jgi:hypothetical protein